MRLAFLGVVTVTVGIMARTVTAEELRYHAALCRPQTPADSASILYNYFGVHDESTAQAASVQCGMTPLEGTDVAFLDVVVSDRSNPGDVCCFLDLQDGAGNLIFSTQQCTSGNSTNAQTLLGVPPSNVTRI